MLVTNVGVSKYEHVERHSHMKRVSTSIPNHVPKCEPVVDLLRSEMNTTPKRIGSRTSGPESPVTQVSPKWRNWIGGKTRPCCCHLFFRF